MGGITITIRWYKRWYRWWYKYRKRSGRIQLRMKPRVIFLGSMTGFSRSSIASSTIFISNGATGTAGCTGVTSCGDTCIGATSSTLLQSLLVDSLQGTSSTESTLSLFLEDWRRRRLI